MVFFQKPIPTTDSSDIKGYGTAHTTPLSNARAVHNPPPDVFTTLDHRHNSCQLIQPRYIPGGLVDVEFRLMSRKNGSSREEGLVRRVIAALGHTDKEKGLRGCVSRRQALPAQGRKRNLPAP